MVVPLPAQLHAARCAKREDLWDQGSTPVSSASLSNRPQVVGASSCQMSPDNLSMVAIPLASVAPSVNTAIT